MTRTESLIADHEGFRSDIYQCTAGHNTIGYGFNLDAGMSEDEALILMQHRISLIREHLSYVVPAYNSLSGSRQDVLIDMTYNLGFTGLLKFRKMLNAIDEGNFTKAAFEMSNSEWKDQVGRRADRLITMMTNG